VHNVYNELIQKDSNGTFPPKQGNAVDAMNGIIKLKDMHKAYNSMPFSTLELAVTFGTNWQVLMIVALAALQRDNPTNNKGFDKVDILNKILSMANSLGLKEYFPCPQLHMLNGMFDPMAEAGLLRLRTKEHAVYTDDTLVYLTLTDDIVRRALRDTFHRTLAARFLPDNSLPPLW